MNRFITLLLLLAVGTAVSFAQDRRWAFSKGGNGEDAGVASIELPDGGFIIVGYTASFKAIPSATYSAYFIRVDRAGEVLWERSAGQYYWVAPMDAFLRGNEFVVVGHGKDSVTSSTGSDIYVGRFSLDGFTISERMVKRPLEEYANGVLELPDGSLVVGGFASNLALLYNITVDGGVLWRKTYEVGGRIEAIDRTPDGGFVATGTTNKAPALNDDPFVLRTSSSGDSLWVRTYGTSERETSEAIGVSESGEILIAGLTRKFNEDALFTRISATGSFLGSRIEQAVDVDVVRKIRRDGDGFLIGGLHNANGTSGAIVIGKITGSGEFLWSKSLTPIERPLVESVRRTADGGLIVVGSSRDRASVYVQSLSSEIPSAAPLERILPLILDLW